MDNFEIKQEEVHFELIKEESCEDSDPEESDTIEVKDEAVDGPEWSAYVKSDPNLIDAVVKVEEPPVNSTCDRIQNKIHGNAQQSEVMSQDIVGFWDIPLSDGIHRVEFEHGTTTGKRVITVNGKEIMRKDWMFKLVGDEVFYIGKTRCVIHVEPCGGFAYEYSLLVDGKSLHKFTESRSKTCVTWVVPLPQQVYRIVLEKDSLDVWANGDKMEITTEFVENGTETHFFLGNTPVYIKAIATNNKKDGLVYNLIANDQIVPPEV